MRRILVLTAAAILAALLVVVPPTVAPSQAADTVASFVCPPGSSLCNPANLPILIEAGIVSAGGATAATGATAAAAATGLAGSMGFYTVLGSAVAATALMTLKGVEDEIWIKTDPGYSSGALAVPGFASAVSIGPYACASGGTSVEANCAAQFHRIYNYTVNVTGLTSSKTYAESAAGAVLTLTQANTGSCSGNGSAGVVVVVQAYSHTGATIPTGSVFGESFPCSGGVISPPGPKTYTLSSSLGAARLWYIDLYLQTRYYGNSATYRWYNEGAPERPAEELPGYHGTLRTTVMCRAGDHTNPVAVTARVDAAPGDDIRVPNSVCPSGVALSAKVEYQADGTTEWVTFGDAVAPADVGNYATDYPGCFASSQGSTCTLTLERKEGTRWETCGPLAGYCPGWVEEWTETPEIYRCKFGEYAVSIDLCSAFRKPGTLLPNHEQPDPDEEPTPLPPTAPQPESLPNPVKDPATGENLEAPPWLDTAGEVAPGSDSGACFPTGWGILNPVSWVLMPVQCALKWAFVPREAELRLKLDQFKMRVNGWITPAVGVITTITGAVTIAASGCQGPPLRLNIAFQGEAPLDQTYYPMSACDAPMDAVASGVNGMLSFAIIMWMGLAIVRYFTSMFGMVPFGGGGGETRFVDSRTGEVLD